jgi:hypothetical protein
LTPAYYPTKKWNWEKKSGKTLTTHFLIGAINGEQEEGEDEEFFDDEDDEFEEEEIETLIR